jgi:broad specificity phosphatase PhoE
MTRFIIIRHGFSQGNKEKRFSGQMDVPLDAVGVAQARSIERYILENYKVDCVYASDLCRAVDTVKPLANALSLPIKTMKALREIDVGLWEGMLRSDAARCFPEGHAIYLSTPGLTRFDGGESFAEMRDRALAAVREIVARHEGETVVVATHGGVIRALRTIWENIPLAQMQRIPHVPNASVTVVRYEGDTATPVAAGLCDYLTEKTTEKLPK